MNNPRTYVAFVVDKSGSMQSIRNKVVTSFNEQVQQMKLNEADGQEIFCSLVSFNSAVTENLWNVRASEMKELSDEDYTPAGGTAMLDALGYTLTKLRAIAEEDAEAAFLVIVLSDGDTNSDSSKFRDPNRLRPLVESCEKEKRWTISYIGCDRAYLSKVSAMTGIATSQMAVADYSGDDAFTSTIGNNLTRCTADYFSSRKRGIMTMNYCSSATSGGEPVDWASNSMDSIDLTNSRVKYAKSQLNKLSMVASSAGTS